jgi:hypothetical protein
LRNPVKRDQEPLALNKGGRVREGILLEVEEAGTGLLSEDRRKYLDTKSKLAKSLKQI